MNHDAKSRGGMTADPDESARNRQAVGGLLRASRLRCGEETEDIASVLRIRARHLEALEDGRHADLPGSTYAIGFVRAYAEHLGLDADEVVRRFKEELGAGRKAVKQDLIFPEPMSEGGVPRSAVIFVGVIVALLAYGGWYMSSVDNEFYTKWVAPIPERLAGLLPADRPMGDAAPAVSPDRAPQPQPALAVTARPELVTAPASLQTQPEPAVSVTPEPASLPQPDIVAAAEPAEPAEPAVEAVTENTAETNSAESVPGPVFEPSPAAAVEMPAPEPGAPAVSASDTSASDTPAAELAAAEPADEFTGISAGEAVEASDNIEAEAATPVREAPSATAPTTRVRLTVVSDSWVKIYDKDTGDRFIEKLLLAGTVLDVPDREGLVLDSGNAGGLELRVDGDFVQALGESGEVVRQISVEADTLKAR